MQNLNLSAAQNNALAELFYYRGMTAQQIAKLHYNKKFITVSNEKYMYRQLKELEDMRLVLRLDKISNASKYAVYSLTKKGYAAYQVHVQVLEGYTGSGWYDSYNVDHGYFEYKVYSPPRRQIQHHLMLIDMFIEMRLRGVEHRNNLYAKRTAQSDHRVKMQMLRPDAEMIINGEIYTLEIDTGTESHVQLVEKFERYFHYLVNAKELYGEFDIQHIVFIVNGEHNGHLERRWTNILAAFYKGTRAMHLKLHLHLVTMKDLERFLQIERDRLELESELTYKLRTFYYGHQDPIAYCAPASSAFSSRNLREYFEMAKFEVSYTLDGFTDVYLASSEDLEAYNVYEGLCKKYEAVQMVEVKKV